MEQNLNAQLQALALKAQSHPHLSPPRQLALSQLVEAIWTSGEIAHPHRGRWPASTYPEIHREALQETCLYICQKIDHYRCEHPVMAWVNNLMGFKIMEAGQEIHRSKERTLPNLDELEQHFLEQKSHRDSASCSNAALLRQFLQEDPEGLLQQKAIRGRPDITFQYLAIARHVQDQTWAEISAQTQIPLQTLCCFFNRRLHKLEPYFSRHLQV